MYSLNLKEIIQIAKNSIRIIIICAVVFGLLLGGYKMMAVKKELANPASPNQQAVNNYNVWNEGTMAMKSKMETDLATSVEYVNNHPLMSLDIRNVKGRLLTVSIDSDNNIPRKSLIRSWLRELSCRELFGREDEVLKKYRNSLIDIYVEDSETNLAVFDIKEYDYIKVAKTIQKYLERKLSSKGIKVIEIANNEFDGMESNLRGKQDNIRNNVISMQNNLASMAQFQMESPEDVASANNSKSTIIIYGLIGLLLGALIGLLIALIRVVRRGVIVSPDQMEDIFGIEKLGRADADSDSDCRLVDMVVSNFAGGNEVVVISDLDDKKVDSFCDKLDSVSEISYSRFTTDAGDEKTVREILDSDTALIPVLLGKTDKNEIDSITRWASRFKKEIMGFVVVD